MPNRTPSFSTVAVALGSMLASVACAEGPIWNLAPASTNSLVLVDVAGLHASALGKAQNWAAKHAEDYAVGAAPFPPNAATVMFAREVDARNLRNVRREVGAMTLVNAVGFDRVTAMVHGKVETLAGRKIVASPHRFLAGLLEPTLAVAYYPDDRQAFGRWLKTAATGRTDGLSPYLARVAASWPRQGQFVAAVELSESVDEAAIAEELERHPDVGKNAAAAQELARIFARIEGMRFTIAVQGAIEAQWIIDFVEPFAGSTDRLRSFMDGSVKRLGDTHLNMSKWKMTVAGKSVALSSPLTTEQLQEVLKSIHSPILAGASFSRSGATVDATVVNASKKYYRSVRSMVRALDRFAERLSNYNQAATEYEKTAARIQRLANDNVDPELVEYAESVAAILFGMASSLRGVPREAAVQDAQLGPDRYYRGPIVVGPSYADPGWTYPWRWGVAPPVFVGGGPSPISVAQGNVARSMADEAKSRREEWLKVRELGRAVEKRMENKFGADFSGR